MPNWKNSIFDRWVIGVRIESIGKATLYLADCRDVLPSLALPDAIIADPPYGMNLGAISGGVKGRFRKSNGQQTDYNIIGDDEPFDPAHLLVSPKVILWGANHYASRLPDARKWIVWDKRAGGTPDNQADVEVAWTNLPGPARMFTHLWRGMIRSGEENVSKGSYRVHPAQKPVALMSFCIAQCGLQPGSSVCDPYMGSGSTGVAHVRQGGVFVGIEIDPTHFETACRRIAEAALQPALL